ncbi:MAG: hypothetical protein HKN37_14125, partial [Rhodothermales bacterium]|nr:hypothetical protein [Rhodothermales bacterium]
SEIGSECEECGFIRTQQDGLRWPGIYRFTDMQAAKAFWIGAANVTDDNGQNWAQRVVHVGPRVSGQGEFFPVRFEDISRFAPPIVTVDGEVSEAEAAMVNDLVDPDMIADRMIINEVNTLLGITMERKIMQFSQGFHDNYHVMEFTFTNTGNTDDDADIELPNQTLEDVYFFWQWRLSVAKETRYVVGNGTGWGLNAMLDTRGDGVKVDPPDEQFRAQFVWHGKFPSFTAYNNIGGPIMPPAAPAVNIATTDTLGRLGASQFVGVVTLHADTSPTDPTDDIAQPSTTSWIGSDDPYQSQNDAFNPDKMRTEYSIMSAGHKSPRHADVVEPSGLPGFLNPSGDPSLGTPGGYSNANGYGPYTLGPGESVRIVMAEGAAGLSREANLAIGRAYRESGANDGAAISYGGVTKTKNEWVFTSRDSLFQTFRRAIANFESGYSIPRAPAPPSTFDVTGGGDRISLAWDVFPDQPAPSGFEIYRARGRFDSTYVKIHDAGGSDRGYDDTTPIRGIDYYYYIVAVGDGSANDGTGLTPAGVRLRSSRYYTQTFSPARLKRQQGSSFDDRPCPVGEEFRCIPDVETGDLILPGLRIVPNPFNIGSTPGVRFPDQTDKLAFFNIPGFCEIRIYSELGELVDVISHSDGSGDAFWDHTTSSRQVVASGVYIAVVTVTQDISDPESGELLFREGEKAIKKFIIIR